MGAVVVTTNPYESLGESAFWSPAVAKRNMFDIADLWVPKFQFDRKARVATYGSCFAQHIGRALRDRGFNWMIAETGPFGLTKENAAKFNYGIFSARTGNIYTVSLLKQWIEWAMGKPVPDEVWEKGGRFYDPFRPAIEPGGFASKLEMTRSREVAIECFKSTIVNARVFVFTMGLTESWFNKSHGYEYPMCPGTVAGDFDPEEHRFVNQDYTFIKKTLIDAINLMRKLNPRIKILLTVSPVPLTATMSGNHVLVATMESKSILRAVAGSVRQRFAAVDYFPSYEIITAPPYRGTFFESNLRSINSHGVAHVMDMFFNGLQPAAAGGAAVKTHGTAGEARAEKRPPKKSKEDVVCEEELLNAFAK